MRKVVKYQNPSPSPAPISIGDGANDMEEEDPVDRGIGCSVDGTPLRSMKRARRVTVFDLDLHLDSGWEAELARYGYKRRPWIALHIRRVPAFT